MFEEWASQHAPSVYNSLAPGATEEELNLTEAELKCSLPAPLRLMYRVHNGQNLLLDTVRDFHKGLGELPDNGGDNLDPDELDASLSLGMFGGYQFYDKNINTRLLTLKQMVFYSKKGFSAEIHVLNEHPDMVIFAASVDLQKRFYLKCETGDVYVSMRTISEGVMPAAPLHASLEPAPNGSRPRIIIPRGNAKEGNLMDWFEEYCCRLHAGVYKVEMIQLPRTSSSNPSISLFPQTASYGLTEHITKGVRVRASPIFCPEMCSARGGNIGPPFFWTYSISFELLKDCENRPGDLEECQLTHRFWRIVDGKGTAEEISGEAVVGLYPHLKTDRHPSDPVFAYQSCTSLENVPGRMGGHFTFVPGTIANPKGRSFEAIVEDFTLMEPDFIY